MWLSSDCYGLIMLCSSDIDHRPGVYRGRIEYKVAAVFTGSSVRESVGTELHQSFTVHSSLCLSCTARHRARLELLGSFYASFHRPTWFQLLPLTFCLTLFYILHSFVHSFIFAESISAAIQLNVSQVCGCDSASSISLVLSLQINHLT